MADPLLLAVLEIGHVLSAIGWFGGSLLTAFVIAPNLQTLAAPARLEFIAKINPKIVRYIMGMIIGTLVFGFLLLYFFVNGDFSMLSPTTTFGVALSAGIAIALITAVFAFAVIFPTFGKVSMFADQALKSGGPPPPEMMKYAMRARVTATAGAFLLLLVVVLMVAAGFY